MWWNWEYSWFALRAFLAKATQVRAAIISNLWVFAFLWPLYAVVPNVVAMGILMTVLFFFGPIYNVDNASYRLALVPDAFQGRVNSAVRLISFASQPLGLAATGVLIQGVGADATVLVGAGVLMLVALLATMSSHVRKAGQGVPQVSNVPGRS